MLLPELCGIGGWVDVSGKFWAFCGWKSSGGVVDGRSFKDAANISGWPVNTVVVEEVGRKRRRCDVEVRVESTESNMNFLGRCLVGRLEDEYLAQPATLDVQRWFSRTWKVSAGEMGGRSFLFTMPSFEEAQRVLKEKWSFDGSRLDLEWWSPVGSCVKKGDDISEVWVRILGLPLHLWDFEVFKAIGNFCGVFLRVDDDTMQKKAPSLG